MDTESICFHSCANLNNGHIIDFVISLNYTNAASELLSLERCPVNLTLSTLKDDLKRLKKNYDNLQKKTRSDAEKAAFHSFLEADYIFPNRQRREYQKKAYPELDKIHDTELLQKRALDLETELSQAKDLHAKVEETHKRKLEACKEQTKDVKEENRDLKKTIDAKDESRGGRRRENVDAEYCADVSTPTNWRVDSKSS